MNPRPIRLLPATSAGADLQLAAGIAMLAGLEHGTPAIRWYTMQQPALLLGMSQQRTLLDQAACAAAGVGMYRRRSGGGVVLADQLLLMLDLALPHSDALARTDLTEAYRWLGEAAAAALQTLGIAARVVSIEEARADTRELAPTLKSVCFAGRSPYEVLWHERKLVGLAQIRRRYGALFQLGVYTRWEPQRTAQYLALAHQERPALTIALHQRVAGLGDMLAAPVDVEHVKHTIQQAIEDRGRLQITPDDWRADECATIDLERPNYAPLPPTATAEE